MTSTSTQSLEIKADADGRVTIPWADYERLVTAHKLLEFWARACQEWGRCSFNSMDMDLASDKMFEAKGKAITFITGESWPPVLTL